MNLENELVLAVDYSDGELYGSIDPEADPSDFKGEYPMNGDTPYHGYVTCKDQYGNIIGCTTDMDGNSINIELLKRNSEFPKFESNSDLTFSDEFKNINHKLLIA